MTVSVSEHKPILYVYISESWKCLVNRGRQKVDFPPRNKELKGGDECQRPGNSIQPMNRTVHLSADLLLCGSRLRLSSPRATSSTFPECSPHGSKLLCIVCLHNYLFVPLSREYRMLKKMYFLRSSGPLSWILLKPELGADFTQSQEENGFCDEHLLFC